MVDKKIINGDGINEPGEAVSDRVPEIEVGYPDTTVSINDGWGIPIPQLARGFFEDYDNIEEIHIIHHPSIDALMRQVIYLRVSEDCSKKTLDYYPPEGIMWLDYGDSEFWRINYVDVVLEPIDDTEYVEGEGGTTIYRSESAENGGEPRALEDGLRRLGKKLCNICPICGTEFGSAGSHLTKMGDCRSSQGSDTDE
jgi:hypothetical protein